MKHFMRAIVDIVYKVNHLLLLESRAAAVQRLRDTLMFWRAVDLEHKQSESSLNLFLTLRSQYMVHSNSELLFKRPALTND